MEIYFLEDLLINIEKQVGHLSNIQLHVEHPLFYDLWIREMPMFYGIEIVFLRTARRLHTAVET